MLKKTSAALAVLIIFLSGIACKAQNPSKYNFDFEQLNKGKFTSWHYGIRPGQKDGDPFLSGPDSVVKQQGKYSIFLEKGTSKADFGSVTFNIPKTFSGGTITFKGYIKTSDVNMGYAGLWLRIDGKEKTIAFDNMNNRGIKGTTDWTEYTIELPYNKDQARSINGGVLLVGGGKVWLDNVSLYIDDKPIEQATDYKYVVKAVETDTAFNKRSGIETIGITGNQSQYLSLLGQVWGFLKYHHPEVAKGNFNWDAELFRVLPAVQVAKNDAAFSVAIEKWVDKLGKPSLCKSCGSVDTIKGIKITPNYGQIFTNKAFSKSLNSKLEYIKANRNTGPNYYIGFVPGIGNPDFASESQYSNIDVNTDAGYRMLALFRYWNMIQYYFPYRHLIGEDWVNVLNRAVPELAKAANSTDYTLAMLKVIAAIHDTHANIWGQSIALRDYKGIYSPPFQAKFIENKLVVTGYYKDTLDVKTKFKVGDIISKINGVTVEDLIKKNLVLTAASNYETQLRNLPNEFLLRSTKPDYTFEVDNGSRKTTVSIAAVDRRTMDYSVDYNPDPKAPAYNLLTPEIGYIFPARYKNEQLPAIKTMFKDTKGIIVDMRCYPSDFMPFTFGNYIKSANTPFVKFTSGSTANPGSFAFGELLNNGENSPENYKGKVVVVVNATSQSQAEYTTMAFQSSPNVTVLGSTTAAADGNVSAIYLPGGIYTMISGIGVYYPDGTETQRKGVKIDVPLNPTIKGIRNGRDELLEKAKELITKQ